MIKNEDFKGLPGRLDMEVKNTIWSFVKQANICISYFEEFTYINFEIFNHGGSGKCVLRIYDKSGTMIKQWKGMRYKDSLYREMDHQRDNGQKPVSSYGRTYMANGVSLPLEDRTVDLYDLFPDLPRYDVPRHTSPKKNKQ